MEKIDLLKNRRAKLLSDSLEIRKTISELIDKDSFVELDSYSFSKNEFYGEDAEGEGVVTGFATIEDYPFYIVAQNFKVLSGGASKANCNKILKCQIAAEKSSTPIIYILNTLGVQIGEGINVLEGMANLIKKCAELKGIVPQFSIINGDCYGQLSIISAICDFNFMFDNSILAANSPLVISAKSGKNLEKIAVGGVKALANANLASFSVKNNEEIKNTIYKIIDLLPDFGALIIDIDDDLNKSNIILNKTCNTETLIKATFDKDSILEIGKDFSPEIKCVLGRIGGISVASVMFGDDENGVALNLNNVAKVKEFVEFAANYNMPLINFVNAQGIEANLATNNSMVLKEIAGLINSYNIADCGKISVVYKNAIGLGYSLFVAKSMGYDYSFAFANSKIALFDNKLGAEIEFDNYKVDKEKLSAKYADENSDPINAAKGGYIDNIIEPAFVKQYLIASLQMLIR